MASEMVVLRREVGDLKRKVMKMEHILKEDYELSAWAKKELAKARLTSKERYISQKQMLDEFSMK